MEMKRLAQEKGVVIYENSPVIDFKKISSSLFQVKTGKGEITTDYLVFATNAYSILFPQLKSIQRPVFTHIVMTEPLSDQQLDGIGWKNRAGIEDARDLIHYYRLTKDNRIVMGGGDVSLGYGSQLNRDLNEKHFSHLQNHVLEIFPQLKGIRFTHKWGGPVSVTLDMAPVIGYLGENKKAIFSMGCLGHGVSMTTTNGKAIAEMICEKKNQKDADVFYGQENNSMATGSDIVRSRPCNQGIYEN